jgi:hypothetical protein
MMKVASDGPTNLAGLVEDLLLSELRLWRSYHPYTLEHFEQMME